MVEKFLQHLRAHETELYICDLVAAEAVYVLQSFYRRPKAEIAERLKAFFVLPGIVVEQRQIVFLALDWYTEHNIDFTDAYVAAKAQASGIDSIFTFDKDFSVFPWLSVPDLS